MNPKTTWLLVALAVALGAYIFLVERHSLSSTAQAEYVSKVFPELDPERIDAVEISRDRQHIRAQRIGGEWRLSPSSFPAQQGAIESLLKTLAALKNRSYLTAQELSIQPGARTGFGLEPPQVSVTLQQGTNRIQFAIGLKTLAGPHVYLQRIGDAGISVTAAAVLDQLPENATAWRNPLVMPDPRIAFDQLWVTNGTSIFAVQRDSSSQRWNLVKPIRTQADARLITYVIQELRTLQVTRFVTDDPKADLEPYGLTAPALDLSLVDGTNRVLQFQFGNTSTNDPAQIFARLVPQNSVVLIPKLLADLLRQPHTTFRDRTLVSFNPAAIDRIEAVMNKRDDQQTFAVQRNSRGAWQIAEPFQAAAEPASIKRFLNSLSKIEIIEFTKDVVTDWSAYGLEQPARQYTLMSHQSNSTGVTSRVLARIEFGDENIDKIFARRGAEKSVYAVSLGDLLKLPQSAFEFRSRRIWNFASSNVVSISVTQFGETRKHLRMPDQLWSADLVFHEAVETTLQHLGDLTADDWVASGEDKLSRFGIFPDGHRIMLEVREGKKLRTVSVDFSNRLSLSGQRYAAVNLENDHTLIFKFPASVFSLVEQNFHVPIAPAPH